jgi:hypothetical protein
MLSPSCEVEGGGLSGLPFDSTGTLDSDHKGQQNAPYLTRGRSNSACRLAATAVLLRAALAHQPSVTIAIITNMIRSILSSSSLTTVPLLHSCHPPLLLTEKMGPSRWRGLSTSARDAGGVAAPPKRRGGPSSVSLLWSSGLIALPCRPSTSAESGHRDHGHSESLCHGSAARIRRARAPLS